MNWIQYVNQLETPSEEDSRTWEAPDLEKFLAWWLNGQITV
jgi:hypothetical protein